MKTYYLKVSELCDKLADARKYGMEASVITNFVKPTCLIINEIGKYVFDKESASLLISIVDRRYSKYDPNVMILTSNTQLVMWEECFTGKDDLSCFLDRLIYRAKAFMIKGGMRTKSWTVIKLLVQASCDTVADLVYRAKAYSVLLNASVCTCRLSQ